MNQILNLVDNHRFASAATCMRAAAQFRKIIILWLFDVNVLLLYPSLPPTLLLWNRSSYCSPAGQKLASPEIAAKCLYSSGFYLSLLHNALFRSLTRCKSDLKQTLTAGFK